MSHKFIATVLAATVAMAALAGPVSAQTTKKKRQQDKNTMRNVGIGLGALSAERLLKGRGTEALIAGAGAAYAGKKYEDARKAQARETGYTRRYVTKNGKRVGYYKIKNGKRVGYVRLARG
jgi:hypothetical protein